MIRIIPIALAALILFVLGVNFYLSPDDLSRCEAVPAGGECTKAGAIVAISGGDTDARTQEAIELFEQGWADLLIFSGAAQDKSGPSNAAAMRALALAAGVPESSIVIEEHSETTKQNAENVREILEARGVSSVILVTSPYHQRRAGLEFEKLSGASVTNHPAGSDRHWSGWWWLTPRGWYLAVGEMTKIIAFYLGGTR